MNIAFRVDASSLIGTGHLMRCLTLADAVRQRGASVTFVTRAHRGNLIALIQRRGFDVIVLPLDDSPASTDHHPWLGVSWTRDADECRNALARRGDLAWLIVDHYALDARWEGAMRPSAARIFAIDDLADRDHDVDALLDANLQPAMESRYLAHVPRTCRLFLGPRNVLLRPEFDDAHEKLKRMRRGKPRRILIQFGGVDHANDTLAAARMVEELHDPDLATDVVIGPASDRAAEVKGWCAERAAFRALIAPRSVAQLMVDADLAIGAGGVTTFERLYLRLPSIVKAVSENQVAPLRYMSELGLLTLVENDEELRARLRAAVRDGVARPPECVSSGTQRIAGYLGKEAIELAVPCADHVRRTYRWLKDPTLRADFMIREAPERHDHLTYWRTLLGDSSQRVFAILRGGNHVGNCGLKSIDPAMGTAELWIYIGEPRTRGAGVGHAALVLLLNRFKVLHDGRVVYLHVRRDNSAALRLYERLGFSESEAALGGAWAGHDAEMLRMEVEL